MIISVVAANGRTGKAFVMKALEAGHMVRAGIHNKPLGIEHANLSVIKCDGTKEADIKELITGSDVVACFIGHTRKSAADIQTRTIVNVLKEMKRQHIERLISLTGTGVRFDGDNITLIDRILNLSIGLIDPKRIRDGIDHVTAIKDSDTRWTIIRVLKLTNGRSHAFLLSAAGPAKTFVSRTEVAEAALDVIEHDSFVRQAPIVSNKKPAA